MSWYSSLRWKLALSFVTLVVGFSAVFLFMAQKTFVADKIDFVFKSQQRQVREMSEDFDRHLERLIFEGRTIVSGYDPLHRRLNPWHQKLFWENPNLLAVEFKPEKASPITLEKSAGLLNLVREITPGSENIGLRALGGDSFVLSLRDQDATHGASLLLLYFQYKGGWARQIEGQTLALLQRGHLIQQTPPEALSPLSIEKLNSESDRSQDSTSQQELENQTYLVTIGHLNVGDLTFIALTAKATALAAIRDLFWRTALFLGAMLFATLALALLLSRRLTTHLQSLAVSAERLGQGDFQAAAAISPMSADEMGVLGTSLQKMSTHMRRQRLEVAEQTRLEEQHKIDEMVQARLFPASSYYKNGHLRLSGQHRTKAGGSGDWWYYYQRDFDLYVVTASAGGSGLAAALLTSASRALFTSIQDQDWSLKEIARAWDRTVYECSRGEARMRAFLLKINVELGEGVALCAGLDAIHLRPQPSGELVPQPLAVEHSFLLGERKSLWLEEPVQLAPGDRLLVSTAALKSYNFSADLSPDQLIEKVQGPGDLTVLALDFRVK